VANEKKTPEKEGPNSRRLKKHQIWALKKVKGERWAVEGRAGRRGGATATRRGHGGKDDPTWIHVLLAGDCQGWEKAVRPLGMEEQTTEGSKPQGDLKAVKIAAHGSTLIR